MRAVPSRTVLVEVGLEVFDLLGLFAAAFVELLEMKPGGVG